MVSQFGYAIAEHKINMKVVVTGGVGFIGSHLVDVLIEKGFEVFIIDNLVGGRLENVNRKAIFLRKT